MSHSDVERCWEAVVERTCAVCLDRTDHGQCHVPRHGDDCALKRYFPVLVDVVRRVRADTMDPYVAAVEAEICTQCPELGPEQRCERRNHGECGLYALLPITVDAIEDALTLN